MTRSGFGAAVFAAAGVVLATDAMAGGFHGSMHGYGRFAGPLRFAPTLSPTPYTYGAPPYGNESMHFSREGGGYPARTVYYGPGSPHLSSGFQSYGTPLERFYGARYDGRPAAYSAPCACRPEYDE